MIYKALVQVEKILSVNSLYSPGVTKYGKPYLYKNPAVSNYQEWLKYQFSNQLGTLKSVEEISWIFLFSSRITSRDVSNMIKIAEDALKESIKLDDSLFYTIHLHKIKTSFTSEYIIVLIEGEK